MPDILHEVTISAVPERVFAALTEQQRLEAWWAPHMAAKPEVGSTVEATFRGGQYVIKMEVVRLEPPSKVEWIPRQAIPEWSGTHVTWNLSPVEKGTRVLFAQRAFASFSADEPLPGSDGWAYYLTSLKEYLETGKGKPGGFVNR